MILLAGADLVLPDRVLSGGSLVIDGDRIAAIAPGRVTPAGATCLDVSGATIVPGFVDVHVHGVEGHDVLDGAAALDQIAARLPAYGVTAFCPTSIACEPAVLRRFLEGVQGRSGSPDGLAARVLPAHLESNFINPAYNGAQPLACLRAPVAPPGVSAGARHAALASSQAKPDDGDDPIEQSSHDPFDANAILDVIASLPGAVGIITLAPELDGGLDLVRRFTAAGHIVSIGHSGATYDDARAAFDAGVRHATHLFNRMAPMTHRAPGAAGAVLATDAVVAELICDGHHVHPALLRLAIRAKGVDGVMAITDGTAGSGLPVGTRTHLGSRTIVVTDRTAELEDGTLAGSVLTMDGAFRVLVRDVGLSLVEAARLCATTPARQVGLTDAGRLEPGALADLVLLTPDLRVRATCIGGRFRGNPGQDGTV